MDNKEKLRSAGLRPTKQRMIIADILLNGSNRHFTSENLQDEINSSGNIISIATVYNCLKKFKNLTRWYELISKREAVQKGYDLFAKGEKVPTT